MNWTLYSSFGVHEEALADSFRSGLGKRFSVVHRKKLDRHNLPAVGVFMGVKGRDDSCGAEIGALLRANKKHYLFVDKGYFRSRTQHVELMDHYRFSFDSFQPIKYMMRTPFEHTRFRNLGVATAPLKTNFGQGTILYCGSSQKYCDYHNLGNATDYARAVINRIKFFDSGKREVVYRPKPSWRDAVPIKGTTYSTGGEHFADVVARADVVVTHGSNACLEAVVCGTPAITLGEAITDVMVKNTIENLPEIPALRQHRVDLFLAAVAYQQWSLGEIADGTAITHFNKILTRLCDNNP